MTKPISEDRIIVLTSLLVVCMICVFALVLTAVFKAGEFSMWKQCRAGRPDCVVPHVHQQEPPVLKTLLEGFALEDSSARH